MIFPCLPPFSVGVNSSRGEILSLRVEPFLDKFHHPAKQTGSSKCHDGNTLLLMVV